MREKELTVIKIEKWVSNFACCEWFDKVRQGENIKLRISPKTVI